MSQLVSCCNLTENLDVTLMAYGQGTTLAEREDDEYRYLIIFLFDRDINILVIVDKNEKRRGFTNCQLDNICHSLGDFYYGVYEQQKNLGKELQEYWRENKGFYSKHWAMTKDDYCKKNDVAWNMLEGYDSKIANLKFYSEAHAEFYVNLESTRVGLATSAIFCFQSRKKNGRLWYMNDNKTIDSVNRLYCLFDGTNIYAPTFGIKEMPLDEFYVLLYENNSNNGFRLNTAVSFGANIITDILTDEQWYYLYTRNDGDEQDAFGVDFMTNVPACVQAMDKYIENGGIYNCNS